MKPLEDTEPNMNPFGGITRCGGVAYLTKSLPPFWR